MPSFINKMLRQEEPSEKSEMQHKRDQTSVWKRNVYTKPLQSFVQVHRKVAQAGFEYRIWGKCSTKAELLLQ